MRKYKSKGYLNSIIAAVSYGTNPLFALPMYKLGMNVNSILFYRYFIAVIIYGCSITLFKKVNLKVTIKEFICLLFVSFLFAISSITLFQAFKYLDSGITCTILFIYPVIVAFISSIFYKEKLTKTLILALLIIFLGVFVLNGGISCVLNPFGVVLALSSALSYAFYAVFVKYLKPIKHLKYEVLSFYVMLITAFVFMLNLRFCTQLQPINDWRVLACTLALAIFPTIISLETMNVAIRLIGPTIAAMLGALEPITAIFFGILFFNEVLTFNSIIGIVLIILGVFITIARNNFKLSKNP